MDMQFPTDSVPVLVAAGVRSGIISGWLLIGKATRNGKPVTRIEEMDSKYGRTNFYISRSFSTRKPAANGKE